MFDRLIKSINKSKYSDSDFEEKINRQTILTLDEISELLLIPLYNLNIPEQHTLTTLGDYQSIYRGHGVEFEELRPYIAGDDVRKIDWRATARADKPYVRVHRLEQRASILIYLDYSITMQFGTRVRLKLTQATRLAILLISRAYKKDINVTIALYNGKQTHYFRKSDAGNSTLGLIQLINNFYYASDTGNNPQSSYYKSLESILHTPLKFERLYILSDFSHLSQALLPILANISNLRKLSLIRIFDKKEYKLPKLGRVVFFDVVNKHYLNIDSKSTSKYKEFLDHMKWREVAHKKLLNKIGLNFESCAANENTHDFFMRSRMNL